MRVISGTAGGRKLKEPTGFDIRPTSDLVKESIFNIVQFDIEGRRVLDLFAGTGQLGIEALSRGAKSAVFVDINQEAVRLIRENLRICGFTDSATVFMRDVLKYLERISGMSSGSDNIREPDNGALGGGTSQSRVYGKFDLIFIDAPYNTPLAGETIQKIIKFDKLDTNGIIMCETEADSSLSGGSPPYFLAKEYKYGSRKITRFYRD